MNDYEYLKNLEKRIEHLESIIKPKDAFEFSVGQTVFFYHTEYGRNSWDADNTIVYPTELEITSGKISKINQDMDYVQIEVSGYQEPVIIGYTYFHDWVFKNKEEALQAMYKKLKEIRLRDD
jgi:hypothetical protein